MTDVAALVYGSRHFADREILFAALDAVYRKCRIAKIIAGDACGADKMAGDWADERGVAKQIFIADWHKLGKGAGPARNQLMIEAKPDCAVGFPMGGPGSADMRRRLDAAGVPVWEPQQSSSNH